MTDTEGPHQERTAAREVVPATPAFGRQVRTTSGSRYAPDAVIAALVGLVLLVIGLIAIVRGGFSGPMSDPVVNVLGFTHTTTLGLIEIGLGVSLLVSGAARSRAGAMFFGGVLGVAGFVGAVQTKSFHTDLALESSMAWLAVVAGAVVVLAALLLPRFAKRSSTVTQDSR
jgi:asparagine N-glycosylation enzyme membrane subunit Stt3